MPSSFIARIAMALTVLAVAAGFLLFYTAIDGEGDSVTDKTIAEVLEAHTDALRARPEVVGTGIGEDIEGFPVVLVVSGSIRALEPK